ncbi:MAG: NAD-dependent epimerase/dehydratase family protein, partial [Candidatus Micrarchaeaceae archaeon]
SNKRIIVTGGAGFIGSNLVDKLSKDNKVYVIDNMHTGSEENLAEAMKTGNVQLIKDDAKNIGKQGIDADMVFHLGIYSSSPMYKDNPHLVAEVVDGMISVLEYARKGRLPLVFASTSSIYNGIKPPHKEDIIPGVTDYYTEARISAERLAELYARLYDVNVSAMRFFSVYGRHEKAKGKYANLVSQFLWSMKKGEQPVIYGNGKQRRDFIFADDVVDALIAAMEHAKGFNIYNVGTGKNYSLNELVEKLNAELGTDIKPKYVETPMSNYVMETLAYTGKAKEMLGFEAKVSLDKGIKILNEYYR